MPAPSSYTEDTLATYMHTVLGPVASVLGWTVDGDSYEEAVNETLLAYPVDAISDVTGRAGITKLRALARREVWRAVATQTAADYSFSTAGESYQRQQIHDHAVKMLAQAEADASAYDPRYAVGVDTLVHVHDPYASLPDESRVLP